MHGRMVVELFFILAGFLLAKHYELSTHTKSDSSYLCKTYFFHRFSQLFPEYFFALIMTIFLLSTFAKINTVQPFFLNVFMLAGWGGIPSILPDSWFITVLLGCGFLLFSLLVLEKNFSKFIIFPALAILCCFHLINNKSHFAQVYNLTLGYLTTGTIRGLLGLIVGIYTYWGCQTLKNYSEKWRPQFVTIALFIGEIISVIGLGYILIFQKKYSTNLFNVYFYALFLIGLLYFQKEKLLKFLSWKIWTPFGNISYSLYITHAIVREITKAHFLPWIKAHVISGSTLIVLLSIILAFFNYYGAKYFIKTLKKLAFKNEK